MCEQAEVYNVDNRKARKEHRCVECRGIINVGEFYKYHHGVFDGSGFSDKLCAECHSMQEEINKGRRMDDRICVGELCHEVFDSGEATRINRFMEIMTKRGAKIEDWMKKVTAEANAEL